MVITIRYLPYRQAMVGQIDYNQALDLAIGAQQKDSPRYHETCEMVIRLYFEEFLPAWDELIKRLDKMNSVQMDFKQSYKEGEDTRRFVIPFDIACREFEKQEEVLRDSIISKASETGAVESPSHWEAVEVTGGSDPASPDKAFIDTEYLKQEKYEKRIESTGKSETFHHGSNI
jgi:hypothetical protein